MTDRDVLSVKPAKRRVGKGEDIDVLDVSVSGELAESQFNSFGGAHMAAPTEAERTRMRFMCGGISWGILGEYQLRGSAMV